MPAYDFCIVSYDGVGLPWAVRLLEDGSSVVLYNPPDGEGDKEIGVGIVDVALELPEADVYVFDSTLKEAGELADRLIKEGRTVLGASGANAKLEDDRGYAAEIAQSLGFRVPLSYDVTVEEAIRIVESSEDTLFVWKSSGDTEANYSVTDPDPVVILEFLSDIASKEPNSKGILQQYIEGVPVSFSGWFDGVKFYKWWALIEDKKFRYKGVGENTGCEISLVMPISSPPKQVPVDKWEAFLRDNGFPGGEYDVNVMFSTEDGTPYWLEFGPRFGWDMDVTYLPLIPSLADELYNMAGYKPYISKEIPRKMALSVRLSVPPYPYFFKGKDEGAKGTVVIVDDEHIWRTIWLYTARSERESVYTLADKSGLVGVAIGVGKTFDDAVYMLERQVLPAVHAPGLSYRGDYRSIKADLQVALKLRAFKLAGASQVEPDEV